MTSQKNLIRCQKSSRKSKCTKKGTIQKQMHVSQNIQTRQRFMKYKHSINMALTLHYLHILLSDILGRVGSEQKCTEI